MNDRQILSSYFRSSSDYADYFGDKYRMESKISRSQQEGSSAWKDEDSSRSLQFYPYEDGLWIQAYRQGDRFHFKPSSLAQLESALDAFLL